MNNQTTKEPGFVPALLFSLFAAVSGILFCTQVTMLRILPGAFCAALWAVILCVCALLTFFLFRSRKRILPKVLAVLMGLLLLLGAGAVHSALALLKEISNVSVSVQLMGVYVENEDPAISLEDARDYTFGILKGLDRGNTDLCLAAIEEELGGPVAVKEYISMDNLADAMRGGEVEAILVNSGYLSLLNDDEERMEFPDEIRLIWSHEIVRDLAPAEIAEKEEQKERSSFVLYISGNDYAGELKSTGRSDVNILMAVNPDTGKILLVNTPRDYFVELSVSNGERDKLTHAGIYGVDVSMGALASLYNIPVDHFVRMNFSGFVSIIDALGGVTVQNEIEFSGRGEYYPAGDIELDGRKALIFARERYSFTDGDRQRGRNQQAVIKGVVQKATSPAILTNYAQVLEAASGTFEMDFTQEQIAALVMRQLTDGTKWTVESISVDGSNDIGPNYSMPNSHVYRMIPDMDSVAAAREQLIEVLGLEE